GVDRKRSLDQRFMTLPRFTRNVPSITGGANHSPLGSRTASPGTSSRASIVMNELSVCGPWPNCSSSSTSWGGVVQGPEIDVRLAGEERREEILRHLERARQHGQDP